MNVPMKAETAASAVPATSSETGAIISMIERAARDPAVDIEKLRQLMQMRSEIEAKANERAFGEAMSAAQSEMRSVAADANNPQTRSKYASYHALDRALRPIYTGHGFSLSFNTGTDAPDQYVRVLCRVTNSGHSVDYHIDMPADGKGAKGGDVMTKTHATGSAISYGMRYLLKMIFNVAVGENDDDGNGASAGEKLAPDQVEWLQTLVVEVGADLPKFFGYLTKQFRMPIGRLEDIPAAKYPQVVDALNAKRTKK